jgi:hypothetical protein
MNTLIWFSIPGAVAVYSLYMSIPQFKALPSSLVIASAPVIGFLIHQLYRTVFEWIGGWENIKRPVLRLISEEYKIPSFQKNESLPFLIWEITFYG